MAPFAGGPAGAPDKAWPAFDSPPGIDNLLAGAGYHVRSSDLHHIAQRLELLESATLAGGGPHHLPLPDSLVHYNPSDLAAWVDSLLSPSSGDPTIQPRPDTWTAPITPSSFSLPFSPPAAADEDSAIQLVHLLMSCAESVQLGDSVTASALINNMQLLLTRVSTTFGIGKVAGYFVDALRNRVFGLPPSPAVVDDAMLYHHFYEAAPYLKFAHFTANQAILEAVAGHDRVHVIDFSLVHGLQWPALIQALALRPGGPPSLRLTGVGPPSPDGRDALREVGLRLAELARSVNVRFTFRGIAATRLDDVRPWMLHVAPGEAVAVNSVFQLHRLLADPDSENSPIDSVLGWIEEIRPKIVTVVEQEADHNKPGFLDRFTEALFYYSTVFDSMDGVGSAGHNQEAALGELYLEKEIRNIVCCEGVDRVERHEPLVRWRNRLAKAGLRPVHLGSNAFKQASMLLTLFSGEGFGVEEVGGCLTLGWHSRPLIAASAWRADDDDEVVPASPSAENEIRIGNTCNSSESNTSSSSHRQLSV